MGTSLQDKASERNQRRGLGEVGSKGKVKVRWKEVERDSQSPLFYVCVCLCARVFSTVFLRVVCSEGHWHLQQQKGVNMLEKNGFRLSSLNEIRPVASSGQE